MKAAFEAPGPSKAPEVSGVWSGEGAIPPPPPPTMFMLFFCAGCPEAFIDNVLYISALSHQWVELSR